MILMIDNYDSFTFNLVHYFQALGEEVLVKRNNEVTIAEIEILSPQYIVISPGPCDPNAAGISLNAIAHFADKTPILGVCLGHQCIAQHFGGQVVKAKQVMHGKVSRIEHNKQGLFANLPQPLAVTRYHSLIVEKQSLPTELEITALTVDGEIMALKHKHYPIASVQFHPESILTEQGQQLLENFIKDYQHYPIS
ncbi:aminodeoxychorismate/anthranilate synthase component II [Colwellia sp. RSH04]|uniref:anthranilate synthase component II n=1 Tax=Colwellia sp. RSH04 TaxID=2305464 RepID=UPI000E5972C7|nr:aminodeoxychorismate/anthranilate synthase component II [Colwellia sp. RSH04]RHW76749.1 aminodeoxychorismate/anthranilate synthase component II [Colwellia sp. RSH04]